MTVPKSKTIKIYPGYNFYLYYSLRKTFMNDANPGWLVDSVYVSEEDSEKKSQDNTGTIPRHVSPSWIVFV